MTRQQAWKKDTRLYYGANSDDSGYWSVIGNNSGFTYKDSMTEQQAKDYAAELNKNKKISLEFSLD